MPHIEITRETLILVLFYILGAAVGLSKLLDTLQTLKIIKPPEKEGEPGSTGTWNQVLALVIALVSAALVHFGAGAGIETVTQGAIEVAAILLASGLLTILAYGYHQLVLIIEGLKPKPTTPTATVTVKTSGDASASAVASSSPAAPETIAPLPTSSTEVYTASPLGGTPAG